MNKRGAYFFVIDAMIASSIIILGLIIIFTTHNIRPETSPTLRIVGEYTDFLISTKIREFQGTYVESLVNDSNITNLDNTLLEQLTEFYFLNQTGPKDKTVIMNNYIQEISTGIIPRQRSFEVYMNRSLLYANSNTPVEEAELVINSKKLSFKRINDTYIYGPVVLEVKVWV